MPEEDLETERAKFLSDPIGWAANRIMYPYWIPDSQDPICRCGHVFSNHRLWVNEDETGMERWKCDNHDGCDRFARADPVIPGGDPVS